LREKVAIVTGGSQGIGFETARAFLAEGAAVLIVSRDAERGHEAVRKLTSNRVDFLQGDVSQPDTAEQAIARVGERFGPVNVLVNNAAVDFTSDLLSTDVAQVRSVFDINVFGTLLMLQAAAKVMSGTGGGAIVNVTSRLASIGVARMAIYSATKGAVLSLTRSAAIELARFGVRVNAVAPGITTTPLIEAWIGAAADPEERTRTAAAAIPQGRFGTPQEVAAAIVFLASDEATHITGASLAVDGGYTAA
jgi:NAD(P)-dependent dehydrogenase (short-subunit alcohol dehydrogenase family)